MLLRLQMGKHLSKRCHCIVIVTKFVNLFHSFSSVLQTDDDINIIIRTKQLNENIMPPFEKKWRKLLLRYLYQAGMGYTKENLFIWGFLRGTCPNLASNLQNIIDETIYQQRIQLFACKISKRTSYLNTWYNHSALFRAIQLQNWLFSRATHSLSKKKV